MTTISQTKNNPSHLNIKNARNVTNDNEEESHYTYAYQLVNSCALPMVMKATIDMGVLKVIHDHADPNGLSPADIAAMLKIPNPNAAAMLDRMLRLLAAYSVVRCTAVVTADGGLGWRYSSSPVTKFLVPDDDSSVSSLAALLNFLNCEAILKSWNKLEEAVLGGGIPFKLAHGTNIFEYASIDLEFNDRLNKAMNQTTTFIIKKILSKYKGLSNIQQLVDVGGGLGHTLHAISSKYPTIKCINFDLPHVISNAPSIPGVEHVCGDMFDSVPKGDTIFMKWILHDWDDEHCLKLLNNCYKALPENGKVIVVEKVMADDEAVSTHLAKAISQMDVLMMAQSPGGKERSRSEFEALAMATGFSGINFVCRACTFWVMEFYKLYEPA